MGKPKTKICKTCGRELTFDQFEETRKGNGRYRATCKGCRNAKRSASRPTQPKSGVEFAIKTYSLDGDEDGEMDVRLDIKPKRIKPYYPPIDRSCDIGRLIKTRVYTPSPTHTSNIMWSSCVEWKGCFVGVEDGMIVATLCRDLKILPVDPNRRFVLEDIELPAEDEYFEGRDPETGEITHILCRNGDDMMAEDFDFRSDPPVLERIIGHYPNHNLKHPVPRAYPNGSIFPSYKKCSTEGIVVDSVGLVLDEYPALDPDEDLGEPAWTHDPRDG